MSFSTSITHASLKRRLCEACRTWIEVGETYTACAGKSDGEFWTAAYHPDCREAEIAAAIAQAINAYYGSKSDGVG